MKNAIAALESEGIQYEIFSNVRVEPKDPAYVTRTRLISFSLIYKKLTNLSIVVSKRQLHGQRDTAPTHTLPLAVVR